MGLGFVLIIYVVVLPVVAAIGGVFFRFVSTKLLASAGPNKRSAIRAAALFPVACVVFAGLVFIGYALINEEVFGRDAGLGDSWQTPLPNGYELVMIDTTDEGTIYNLKTPLGAETVASLNSSISGVRQLQVAKDLIFGARDSQYLAHWLDESSNVDSYFELNTTRQTQKDFQTLTALKTEAASEGVALNLRPFSSVFDDYRWIWFDYVAGAILFGVPAIAFLILAYWVSRVRRLSPSDSEYKPAF